MPEGSTKITKIDRVSEDGRGAINCVAARRSTMVMGAPQASLPHLSSLFGGGGEGGFGRKCLTFRRAKTNSKIYFFQEEKIPLEIAGA